MGEKKGEIRKKLSPELTKIIKFAEDHISSLKADLDFSISSMVGLIFYAEEQIIEFENGRKTVIEKSVLPLEKLEAHGIMITDQGPIHRHRRR